MLKKHSLADWWFVMNSLTTVSITAGSYLIKEWTIYLVHLCAVNFGQSFSHKINYMALVQNSKLKMISQYEILQRFIQQKQMQRQAETTKVVLSSEQIKAVMTKRPYTQQIKGVDYTYSIIKKKNDNFIFTNDRFLMLKGIDSLGYARKFQGKVSLPFRRITDFPEAKSQYNLEQVESVNNDQEKLFVIFNTVENQEEKQIKWEFICETKTGALQWRRKIQLALDNLAEFKESKFEKYEKYVKHKRQQKQRQKQAIRDKSIYTQSVNVTDTIINNQPSNSDLESSKKNTTQKASESKKQVQKKVEQPAFYLKQPQKTPSPQEQVRKKNNSQSSIPENKLLKSESQTKLQNQAKEQQVERVNTAEQLLKPKSKTEALLEDSEEKQRLNEQLRLSHQELQQKIIVRPISTFYKGGQQVDDIVDISNQNNIPQRPVSFIFNGPQIAKIENLILQKKPEELHEEQILSPQLKMIQDSRQSLNLSPLDKFMSSIQNLRRNWVEEIIEKSEISQLIIDFRAYVLKVVQQLLSEINDDQSDKIFKTREVKKDHACYQLEDIIIELYFIQEENMEEDHLRYNGMVNQFKNLNYILQKLEKKDQNSIVESQGQTQLKIPLMVLFEYKGFFGMAKTKIGGQSSAKYCNQQFYENYPNREDFQEKTMISFEIFANDYLCKIVEFNHNNQKYYFLDKINSVLPWKLDEDKQTQQLYRPQLLQQQQFQDYLLGKQEHAFKIQSLIESLLQQKLDTLLLTIQNQQEYFTNSQQLSSLFHFHGLNMNMLGLLHDKSSQDWLKKIIKSEIGARCLRVFYKYDMQSCFLDSSKKNIEQKQIKRIVSFLNIVFGNTISTARIWTKLNHFSKKHFGIFVWQKEYEQLNINYFIQAISHHLNIKLSDSIFEKKLFETFNTFTEEDFIKFEFKARIYNLNFCPNFQMMYGCIEEQSKQAFYELCQIISKENQKSGVPYFQKLKGLEIYNKVIEFMLNFIKPEEHQQLYEKFQQNDMLPSKMIYETKMAEIKWYLKMGKYEHIHKAIEFIQAHGRKWLGDFHPLFVELYRLLYEFFQQYPIFASKAIKYAKECLVMQTNLLGKSHPRLWQDYEDLGKIYFKNRNYDEALIYLLKANSICNFNVINTNIEDYVEMFHMISKSYCSKSNIKEGLSWAEKLFKRLKEDFRQEFAIYMLETTELIQQIYDGVNDDIGLFNFLDQQFSTTCRLYAYDNHLMKRAISLSIVSSIKTTLKTSPAVRPRLISIIQHLQEQLFTKAISMKFFKIKIEEGQFPNHLFECVKNIEQVVTEIESNKMIERWKSFTKISNQTLLEKIERAQINRSFEFLAYLTAAMSLLEQEFIFKIFLNNSNGK